VAQSALETHRFGSGQAQHSGPSSFAVLIPALNCESTIAAVVSGARRFVELVVVVSDGSTDATAERAAAAGAQVLRHARTQGKGAALLTGMSWLMARGVTAVLTMDGDGQHLGEEIPVLLTASAAAPDALVVGMRQVDPALLTPARIFGNRFANRWVEIACGQALPDTQSGFRIYPLRATLALGTHARHFGFETEVLIRAARAGLRIQSVPVQTFYPPAAERISHFRPVRDTLRIILVVLGLIFRVW
jgi:glycosyltransferase involved in cell wall biosynthesis